MKRIFLIFALMISVTAFAQTIDFGIGAGHTWTGSGNALYGVDSRELNFQIAGKFTLKNGLGAYAGFTQDAVRFTNWMNDHNFGHFETSGLHQFTAVDLGAMYKFDGGKIDAWIAGGGSLYHCDDENGTGYFIATGADIPIWKKLFVTLKAEWRSHVKDFAPLQASAFETGLLLGWRF